MGSMIPWNASPGAKRAAETIERKDAQLKRVRSELREMTSPTAKLTGFAVGAGAAFAGGKLDAKWAAMSVAGKEIKPSVGLGGVALLLGIFGGSDLAYDAAEGLIYPHFYNRGVSGSV